MTNKNELYTLDNAAKIYPAAMTKKWNSVYRVSAYLKQNVDVKALKDAVRELAPRFPTYYVQLASDLMWNYFEKVTNYDIVYKECNSPCRPMNVGTDDKPMFRVLYNEKKISVEFFHSLTDGTGAITYLKTLVARYLENCGYTIEKTDGVLDINDLPTAEETNDAFQKLYKKGLGMSRKEADAYRYKAKIEKDYFSTISSNIAIDQLKIITKNKYNCTITEYLVSVYAYSFLIQYLDTHENVPMTKPIKISVPVNLRPYFEINTMRNFASFANIEVYAQRIKSFEDILSVVKLAMATLITKEKLHMAVSQNVSEEKMLISKCSPLFLKTPVMKACFHLFGDRKNTSTISNIGLIKVSESMSKHIESFDFILGGGGHNPVNCGVIGFMNNLTVTFSTTTRETKIIELFFDLIRKDGIALKTSLECNNSVAA